MSIPHTVTPRILDLMRCSHETKPEQMIAWWRRLAPKDGDSPASTSDSAALLSKDRQLASYCLDSGPICGQPSCRMIFAARFKPIATLNHRALSACPTCRLAFLQAAHHGKYSYITRVCATKLISKLHNIFLQCPEHFCSFVGLITIANHRSGFTPGQSSSIVIFVLYRIPLF